MHLVRFALVILALALAACGSPRASVPAEPPPSAADPTLTIADASGAPDGPVLQVADAIANAGNDPMHVQGALVIDPDGTVRLCEALAESFPPQCAGARVVVEGLDLDSLGGLQTGNGVRWLDIATLYGVVS